MQTLLTPNFKSVAPGQLEVPKCATFIGPNGLLKVNFSFLLWRMLISPSGSWFPSQLEIESWFLTGQICCSPLNATFSNDYCGVMDRVNGWSSNDSSRTWGQGTYHSLWTIQILQQLPITSGSGPKVSHVNDKQTYVIKATFILGSLLNWSTFFPCTHISEAVYLFF